MTTVKKRIIPFSPIEGKIDKSRNCWKSSLPNNCPPRTLLLNKDGLLKANMHLNSLFAKEKALLIPFCFKSTSQVHPWIRSPRLCLPVQCCSTWPSLGLLVTPRAVLPLPAFASGPGQLWGRAGDGTRRSAVCLYPNLRHVSCVLFFVQPCSGAETPARRLRREALCVWGPVLLRSKEAQLGADGLNGRRLQSPLCEAQRTPKNFHWIRFHLPFLTAAWCYSHGLWAGSLSAPETPAPGGAPFHSRMRIVGSLYTSSLTHSKGSPSLGSAP